MQRLFLTLLVLACSGALAKDSGDKIVFSERYIYP
jgi:hypothetical protein